jgi:[citrate (pro-3S)-lyase] ligase
MRAQSFTSGAIVMNCNPFTLGHRYLIEYAMSKVDNLYIFVVEEDKSYFKFKDRIELVRQGTADLANVRVIPSGQYIISRETFGLYFEKDQNQNAEIDCSQDVELFAEHIAPAMNIEIRFAGEEPLDNVTKQYNDTMRRILPRYGVRFEIIPRLETDGEVISASKVRKLLENKDFDAIAKLVPKTTLDYLKRNYT